MADPVHCSFNSDENSFVSPSFSATSRTSPSVAHTNMTPCRFANECNSNLRERNRKETIETGPDDDDEEGTEDDQKKLRCLKWWNKFHRFNVQISSSSSSSCFCCNELSANMKKLLRRIRLKLRKLKNIRRPQTNFHYDSLSYAMNFDDGSYYHSNVFSARIPTPSSDTNTSLHENNISLPKPASLCHSSSLVSVTHSLCR